MKTCNECGVEIETKEESLGICGDCGEILVCLYCGYESDGLTVCCGEVHVGTCKELYQSGQ